MVLDPLESKDCSIKRAGKSSRSKQNTRRLSEREREREKERVVTGARLLLREEGEEEEEEGPAGTRDRYRYGTTQH